MPYKTPYRAVPFSLDKVRAEVLRQHLSRYGSVWLALRGGSMHPFLKDGDDVLVVALAGRDAAAGDVVVGVAGRHLVCHRVVRRSARTLITAADATGRQDEPMPLEQCLGRVRAVSLGQPRIFFHPDAALDKDPCAKARFFLGIAAYRCAHKIKSAVIVLGKACRRTVS